MGAKKRRNRNAGIPQETTDKSLKRLAHEYARKQGREPLCIFRRKNKLSQAILDIAKPILDSVMTVEEKRDIVEIAILAWTLSLDIGTVNEIALKKIIRSAFPNANEKSITSLMIFIVAMISRKLDLYPNDTRVPLHYEIKCEEENLFFNVIGTHSSQTI